MITEHTKPLSFELALNALKNEDIFVYPTDTIYGFGGNAHSEKVINRLFDIKERPENMPVSMIVRDLDMLTRYAYVSEKTNRLIEAFLPGALTLVLPAKHISMPDKLFSMQGFLGFRIPDHDFCKALSKSFDGPIITTSVNISGKPVLTRIQDIEKQFSKEIDLMISDPDLEKKTVPKSSTVIMISKDDEIKILREGAIPKKDIFQSQGDDEKY